MFKLPALFWLLAELARGTQVLESSGLPACIENAGQSRSVCGGGAAGPPRAHWCGPGLWRVSPARRRSLPVSTPSFSEGWRAWARELESGRPAGERSGRPVGVRAAGGGAVGAPRGSAPGPRLGGSRELWPQVSGPAQFRIYLSQACSFLCLWSFRQHWKQVWLHTLSEHVVLVELKRKKEDTFSKLEHKFSAPCSLSAYPSLGQKMFAAEHLFPTEFLSRALELKSYSRNFNN